jgi:peptidoglycan/LPS O-acetylase OafA/YrhL
VLAVIVYHAAFAWRGITLLPGGFLGVDVFFVISGFLITSIILRELKTTERFSFARFYERRARRILPTLFLVMLVSLPFAWGLMVPSALREYSGSGLSSLFFGSNFWFWLENSYTAEISQLKPFLHTWTLSVEEQFYVFFPILLIVTWKLFKRWTALFVVVLGLVSLQLAEYGSHRFADAAFYLLPSRGWELLAGAILAFFPVGNRSRNGFVSSAIEIAPALGIFMIIVSMVTFHETMRHPSYVTAFPIIGTLLFIRYATDASRTTRLLSTPLLVGVGLISYSLYLWHFPVFVFARLSDIPLTIPVKLALVALSVGLAICTYFGVEEPFRRKSIIPTAPFTWVAGVTFVLLAGVFAAIFTGRALPAKYAKTQDILDFQYTYQPIFREGTCFLAPQDMEPFATQAPGSSVGPFDDCETKNASPEKPTLFLWGDSHAAHLFAGYDAEYADRYNIVQRTASACAPVLGRQVNARPGCREINDRVFQEILETKPDRVVLAAYWWVGSSESMRATLDALKTNGIESIEIVGPVPRWETSMPVMLSEMVSAGKPIPVYLSEGLQPDLFKRLRATNIGRHLRFCAGTRLASLALGRGLPVLFNGILHI